MVPPKVPGSRVLSQGPRSHFSGMPIDLCNQHEFTDFLKKFFIFRKLAECSEDDTVTEEEENTT